LTILFWEVAMLTKSEFALVTAEVDRALLTPFGSQAFQTVTGMISELPANLLIVSESLTGNNSLTQWSVSGVRVAEPELVITL